MNFLMQIGFDVNRRLDRDIWYFEYKGVRFKLVQNNSPEYANTLLSIANYSPIDEEKVYQTATEFLGAFSWISSLKVKICGLGGCGVLKDFSLRRAKCTSFTFHKLPFTGKVLGGDISIISKIETEHQRTAISIFRDAHSSSEPLFAFLLFWQILEIDQTIDEAQEWIDVVFKSSPTRFHLDDYTVKLIDQRGKTVGECLREDFRNAIAHLRRKSGRRPIKLDTLEDHRRISAGVTLMEALSKHYIVHKLGLTKLLWLARYKNGFPTYLDESIEPGGNYKKAYQTDMSTNFMRHPKNRAIINRRKERALRSQRI
jgi:hypothetical protein